MKISVTSNISNRIKKIREGIVYQKWLCFVAELLQNSQRAKSKKIDIEVREGCFIISDDGKGCINPNHVFTLDFSHWESSVHAPFGEGFSSLFVIANTIKVRSKDWEAFLDLEKAIDENDFNSVLIRKISPIKGFYVEMFFDTKYSNYEIEEEVIKIASMISQKVILNGKSVDKRSIDFGPLTVRKRLRGIGEIVAAPQDGYGTIEILYEGRPIKNHFTNGIKGLLALRPGAVTLRAPDRRDIIYDEKRVNMENRIKSLTEELLINIIKHHPQKLEKFKSSIKEILHPSQYAKYINYGLLKEKTPNSLSPTEMLVSDLGQAVNSVDFLPVSCVENSNKEIVENSRKEIREIKKRIKKGSIFYRLHEETDLEELQAKTEYLGLSVLVTNELQAKALEWIGVPHLKNAEQVVDEEYKFNRVGAITLKEEKLIELLSPIAAYYGYLPELFSFADIESLIVTKINDKIVKKEKKSPLGVCIKKNGKGRILLSRKSLGIRQLDMSYTSGISSAKNVKALITILPTVAHELSHFLYDTVDNTLKMYKIQEKILREIISLIKNL